MTFDLLLRGGRVIDPATGLDELRDVAVSGGKIAAIDTGIGPDRAKRVIDATGCLVTPGLIDLHSHVYWGGTSLGVDADRLAARGGTTTFVDAGSAGAGNFLGFRRHVMERSKVRIVAYVNISFAGIFGFSKSVMVGECGDLALCNPREVVACVREHGEVIVGVKVRAGRIAGGNSGVAPLDIGLEAADKVGLPLMAHIDEPPPGRSEVLPRLRRGDVLTHCFRPFPNAPVFASGEVRPDMKLARERGVIFDIGHGMGSFDFEVAKSMLKEGLAPDVISSDLHLYCVDGPAFDILVCMSKLMALGMPLNDVLRAATCKPADVIGRPELGRLAVGGPADVALLKLHSGKFGFVDSTGARLVAEQRLVSQGIVAGGVWWPNEGASDVHDIEHFQPNGHETHVDVAARHFGRCCC
ncbi:amidohydrolase/deacetylase family metallohydrolase [Pseudaminobacter sp. 19-2017]|uniref:Amidohydrolase/deacetylase family metallohydrolase n=1 Tax=Pseudaminobacter soli (ex Zhang et al. 2022) TaxID=2831468 RepID=A0A942E0C8_9HYPH|nr:amidohydrolase/deacetylase family metallohydrolase [Pseudaminobacter soli]MBS3650512.1 amidohydrolase/deacetylase family metallohydrolase [Pseudaminobacter soli]